MRLLGRKKGAFVHLLYGFKGGARINFRFNGGSSCLYKIDSMVVVAEGDGTRLKNSNKE